MFDVTFSYKFAQIQFFSHTIELTFPSFEFFPCQHVRVTSIYIISKKTVVKVFYIILDVSLND